MAADLPADGAFGDVAGVRRAGCLAGSRLTIGDKLVLRGDLPGGFEGRAAFDGGGGKALDVSGRVDAGAVGACGLDTVELPGDCEGVHGFAALVEADKGFE